MGGTGDSGVALGLKLWIAYLLLLLGFIGFRVAGKLAWVSWQQPLSLLAGVPWNAIADACLTTLFVSTVYEGWIRRENSRVLHETVMNPAVVRSSLSRSKVQELVEAGFQRLLNNDEFGSQMYSYFVDSAFSASERRFNARVRVTLLPLIGPQYSPDQIHRYYNVRCVFIYEREITSEVMEFRCVRDLSQLRSCARDGKTEFRWLVPPMKLFANISQDFFLLSEVRVGGELQRFVVISDGADVAYRAFVKRKHRRTGRKRVEYTIELKLQRFGHCVNIDITEPTCNYALSLDFSQVDINHVSLFPAYSAPRSPVITPLPVADAPTRWEVEVPGWCIPDSGTVFTWVLRGETEGEGSPSGHTSEPKK